MPETTLDPAATDNLRSSLEGSLFTPTDEGYEDARRRASHGDEKWERLTALKREWDPDNVFRLNVNIPPAAA